MRVVGIFFAFIFLALPVKAQNYQAYNTVFEKLRELNQTKPLQNPSFEPAEDILKRKITDRKNKVIGEINDVTVNLSGRVQAFDANLKRIQLSDSVPLDYDDFGVRPQSSSYTIRFDDDTLQTQFPTLLATIQPAAGNELQGISTEKLMDAKIKIRDGKTIGTVKTILFDDRGEKAEAFYVAVRYGFVGRQDLAIPFNIGVIQNVGTSKEIVISQDAADALTDYLESN